MKRASVVLRVGITVGTLALLLVVLPWSEMQAAASAVKLSVWAAVLFAFVLGHLLGVFKWRLIVNSMARGLSGTDAVRCYSAGLFANLCLPSIVGGDVLRAGLAGRTTGRLHAAVVGGIADRLLDVTSLALLIVGGSLLAGGPTPSWGRPVVYVFGFVVVGAVLLIFPMVLRCPLHRWPKVLRRPIGRSLVALRRLWRRWNTALAALILSLVIQSAFVVLNANLARSMGIDLPLAVWFAVWPLAKVAGLIPISLGGLGVRDGALAALLVPFGVPAAHGFVVSLVWETIMIGGGLLGGLTWCILGRSTDGVKRSGRKGHGN